MRNIDVYMYIYIYIDMYVYRHNEWKKKVMQDSVKKRKQRRLGCLFAQILHVDTIRPQQDHFPIALVQENHTWAQEI